MDAELRRKLKSAADYVRGHVDPDAESVWQPEEDDLQAWLDETDDLLDRTKTRRIAMNITLSFDVEVPESMAAYENESDVLGKLLMSVKGRNDSVKVGDVELVDADIFWVDE